MKKHKRMAKHKYKFQCQDGKETNLRPPLYISFMEGEMSISKELVPFRVVGHYDDKGNCLGIDIT